jgi:DHA2 family multidrug resistance protein
MPIALACAYFAWKLLKRYENKLLTDPIDTVGLVLLIIWVGSLQIMLDEGKQLDWFASYQIIGLAITAVIGFAAFMIWEMNTAHPIVDLRVFRHRGFTISVLTISLAFGAFFGANVLTPLWLQSFMSYTSTQAGMTTAWSGVLAILVAPLAAGLSSKVDPRKLVFIGVLWLGIVTLWRSFATTDMTYWDISIPLLVMGVGLPFFFVPSTGLALASVDPEETASAAGLMNFLRTLSGAFATSLVTTFWEDETTRNRAELVGLTDIDQSLRAGLEQAGMTSEAALQTIEFMINGQSVMLATNQIMLVMGISFVFAASVIWLAPKPTRSVDPAAGGH